MKDEKQKNLNLYKEKKDDDDDTHRLSSNLD